MAKISPLDLTVEQIASIEEAIGVPIDQWKQAPKGRLFPHVLAAFEGKKPEDYKDLTFGALVDRVNLSGEEDKGKAEGGQG